MRYLPIPIRQDIVKRVPPDNHGSLQTGKNVRSAPVILRNGRSNRSFSSSAKLGEDCPGYTRSKTTYTIASLLLIIEHPWEECGVYGTRTTFNRGVDRRDTRTLLSSAASEERGRSRERFSDLYRARWMESGRKFTLPLNKSGSSC